MASYSDTFADFSNWTNFGEEGVLSVSGGAVVLGAGQEEGFAYYSAGAMDSANYYSQAVLTYSDFSLYLLARRTGATTFYYLVDWNAGVTIAKNVAGSRTDIDYVEGTYSDTLKLQADGSTLTALQNGTTEIFNCSDSAITAAGAPGIGMHRENTGTIDNWSAADLAAASSTYPSDRGMFRGMFRGMHRGTRFIKS